MMIQLLIAASIVFSLALEINAAEKLTEKEISDGWILLFDGKTTFGWKSKGSVTVKDGLLQVGGERAGEAEFSIPLGEGTMFLETTDAGSGQLSIKSSGRSGSSSSGLGLAAQRNELTIKFRVNGRGASVRARSTGQGRGVVTTADVQVGGPTYQIQVSTQRDGETVQIKSMKFQPAGLKSIFNGKNLDGWKPIEGLKSKFTVSREGFLTIKDGPGDLQTEGQWKDFVLRLDIRTNGKHLNSGVFFRAIPGQFWSGYESQIRNQWNGEDRTKPVDFGTGGIYGHQPTRTVVPDDNKWFTKTVMAHGSQMAVWVNGWPVSNFTDKRKPSENARQGLKTSAGVITLQGHDPTTDLSFRNIRVGSLAKGEE